VAKINKFIDIEMPVGKVFDFIAEPENLVEIWPSLLEINNIKPLANGGYAFNWTYKMVGLRFQGQTECIEYLKDRRILSKNESGIPSTFEWSFQEVDEGTRVTLKVENTIPGAALGRLAEPVINKMNEQEIETLLANLKVRVEAEFDFSIGNATTIHY
jgi:uncharacterized membrane protein